MGAWGTSLYANDTTCDIRGDYVDQLKRGKTNLETTQFLINENVEILNDVEEAPLFWYALADTQWNYGRLLPEVLDKALYYLKQEDELARWAESGAEKLNAWKVTLKKLEDKLNTPQPAEKKVARYRFYECKWKFGDVYAYQFSSDYSKQKDFWGKYFAMRKISEVYSWPGHIIPVVNIYKNIWDELPNIHDVENAPILELVYPDQNSSSILDARDYRVALMSTSQRTIPKNNLVLIGNLQGNDFIPYKGEKCYMGYRSLGWEGSTYNNTIEKYVIKMLESWC